MPPLATDLFDYSLPPRLVAQEPAARRDESRLLVVDRSAHTVAHHIFADLPATRVVKARTVARHDTAVIGS